MIKFCGDLFSRQALKIRTVAITIYRNSNFDLPVAIAKIAQNFLGRAKNDEKRKLLGKIYVKCIMVYYAHFPFLYPLKT